MRRTLLPVALLFFPACAEPGLVLEASAPVVLALSDVTPVWPLPEQPLASHEELDALGYQRAAPADRDPILPRALFDALPRLTRTDEPDDLYASLTVVAARLDPCFQEGPMDQDGQKLECHAQVRLVLQPIRPDREDPSAPWEARDASLHAFYEADEHEVVDAAIAMHALRVARGVPASGPLRTHPLLSDAEGRVALRRLLRPLLSSDRLVRITATTVHANDTAWTFGGIERDGHAHEGEGEGEGEHEHGGTAAEGWATLDLPTLGAGAHEQHALSDGGTGLIRAVLEPVPSVSDDISVLLDDARARAATRAARQAAYDAAARIENPLLHNPGTVDCGSCHFAAVARKSAEEREPMFASPDAFSSVQFDLTPPPAFDNTEVVRALGYRFRTLAIAPRVIHESALVATSLQHEIDTYDPTHAAEHTHGADDSHD